jgi:hypothetical protein
MYIVGWNRTAYAVYEHALGHLTAPPTTAGSGLSHSRFTNRCGQMFASLDLDRTSHPACLCERHLSWAIPTLPIDFIVDFVTKFGIKIFDRKHMDVK